VLTRYRKYLEFSALLLLAIVIVWWFGRTLDWRLVAGALAASDWRLILVGGMVVLAGYVWRALRWRAFLAPLAEARLRDVWIATTVGYGAVLLIGRMGEIVRPMVLPMRDPGVRPGASLVTIFIERMYDSITVLTLFAVSLMLFAPANAASTELTTARQIGFGFIGVLFVILALLIWFRARSSSVIGWIDHRFNPSSYLANRFKRALLGLMEQLATALRVLANRRELGVTIGWSILLWFSVAAGNLLVVRAFGLQLGLAHVLFVLGWSMIGSAIPTPGGGAGAFHAVTGGALVLLGVPREQAAAVAIVLHLVDFAPAALFGFYYFLRGEVQLRRLRSLVSAGPADFDAEENRKSATRNSLKVAAANK
jgi:glycosyltransferase 2 family protein